jgi:hypothetical protein
MARRLSRSCERRRGRRSSRDGTRTAGTGVRSWHTWRRSYSKLIDIARQTPVGGTPPPASALVASGDVRRTSVEESRGLPTAAAPGGIGSYNDWQVEKRAGASIAELIAEFETNRVGTIAAVEAADEAVLQTSIRSAGGITGELAGVIQAVSIGHVSMHVAGVTGEEWPGPRF